MARYALPMDAVHSERVPVRLTPEQHLALAKYCARRDLPLATAARELLLSALAEHQAAQMMRQQDAA